MFYRDADPEDLRGRAVEDLYGAAVSHWRFAGTRATDATLLRVYNPRTEEHGWQSPHTVVEIVHRDMPFLVDSVRMQINAQGFISHLIIHPVIRSERDASGRLQAVRARGDAAAGTVVESCMHLEISRETDAAALERLERGLARTLADVRAVVDDWRPMLGRMTETVETARREAPSTLPPDEVAEGIALLEWLVRDRFTFLGCRDYDLIEERGAVVLRAVPGSGLGILRSDRDAESSSFATLPAAARSSVGSSVPRSHLRHRQRWTRWFTAHERKKPS